MTEVWKALPAAQSLDHSGHADRVTDEEYLINVMAIGPGVRHFETTYSPEGEVVIYGSNTPQVPDKHLGLGVESIETNSTSS
jgi:hypothetical protein